MPRSEPNPLLHGTLDALILKTLAAGVLDTAMPSRAGLRRLGRCRLTVEEGSLHPSLYRMEKRGWIERGGACRSWVGRRSSTA